MNRIVISHELNEGVKAQKQGGDGIGANRFSIQNFPYIHASPLTQLRVAAGRPESLCLLSVRDRGKTASQCVARAGRHAVGEQSGVRLFGAAASIQAGGAQESGRGQPIKKRTPRERFKGYNLNLPIYPR